ncbi:DUF4825 domain-containing protein [Gracilibacillus sp. S3-1-1]|uniref:DUF4825 domain-containing protein n=1 Tax=Gracilibacillus pellucidus TaxID=3095368 RepID=A0ACC6M0C9_9BACI|nr:DUF4825 domain-containing protein [Gracilibacillus sp. S3-1-1]MDX8044371.1 DUF4825 domain-containing protein [Gracilibacillus sp. S3-1-1]
MRQILTFMLFSLLMMVLLSGCNADANNANVDLFQYKDSYVGDNSAVVNTVVQLQGADYFKGIELETKEEPYGIMVNYDWEEAELNDKETVIYNASYLFTLIQNVDWVTFHFETIDGMESYKIMRADLQEWYGVELSEIDNEDKLEQLIEEALEDDTKIDRLLNE